MICVNSHEIEWTEGMTLYDLAARFGYIYYAVVNGEVIPRKEYSTYVIPDGANVRLIHLIDGG
jgi:thiamine biosynthesis protein ThiS